MNILQKLSRRRTSNSDASLSRPIPKGLQDCITEFRDVPYTNDGNKAHVLDMYCPISYEERIPVIVNIHGGDLSNGSKDANRHFCMRLSNYGFLVFSIEYRSIQETNVFGQLQDIAAAMNHIDKMIVKFRGIPGIVHMVADWAGAFLAYYTACIQRNPILAKAAGVRPSYLEIQSMALISGFYYTLGKNSIGIAHPKTLYGPCYKQHPFYQYLDPARPSIGLSLPPTLFITTRKDTFYRHSKELTESLSKWGCPQALNDYGECAELYQAFCVLEPELPESRMVIHDIINYFKEN